MDGTNAQSGLYTTFTTAIKVDDDDYGHGDVVSNIEHKEGEN